MSHATQPQRKNKTTSTILIALIEHVLDAKHCSKHFTCINIFKFWNNLEVGIIILQVKNHNLKVVNYLDSYYQLLSCRNYFISKTFLLHRAKFLLKIKIYLMVTCASKKNDMPSICMYCSMCVCVFICRLHKRKMWQFHRNTWVTTIEGRGIFHIVTRFSTIQE